MSVVSLVLAKADTAHLPDRPVDSDRAAAEPAVGCLEAEAPKDATLYADLDSIWWMIWMDGESWLEVRLGGATTFLPKIISCRACHVT